MCMQENIDLDGQRKTKEYFKDLIKLEIAKLEKNIGVQDQKKYQHISRHIEFLVSMSEGMDDIAEELQWFSTPEFYM